MEIFKICTICKETLNLNMFNKGNAKHKTKSWCKKCQSKRNGEYKRQPHIRERENALARKRASEEPRYIKTLRYLQRKDYYNEWKVNNWDKYSASNRSKYHSRRLKLSNSKLEVSSLVALESYNLKHFGNKEFTCEYCSSIISGTYYMDHVVPVCQGGLNNLNNLAISCAECNGTRGKWKYLLEDWKPPLVNYIIWRNNNGFTTTKC